MAEPSHFPLLFGIPSCKVQNHIENADSEQNHRCDPRKYVAGLIPAAEIVEHLSRKTKLTECY
jgi:hypothetical protein